MEIASLTIAIASLFISTSISIYQWVDGKRTRQLQQETLDLRKELLTKAVDDYKHKKKLKEMRNLMKEIKDIQKKKETSSKSVSDECYSDKIKQLAAINNDI